MACNKLSVLVTFYNQESYVDKALSSIISQKVNFKYNIIVGDDGSSDGTLENVYKWIKKYPEMIEVHVMPRENGVVVPGFRASRNRLNLLKYVTGDYFIFLDGDDYYSDDNKLQCQVDILDAPNNADCVASAHNIRLLYPNGEETFAVPSNLKESKVSAEMYWGKYYFHTDTLMVRSELIKKIPIHLVENNFNDNLITFLVIQNGLVYYVPKCMAVYSQTQGGIWTGEKKAINSIRNIFLYDLCMIINPTMKKETENKFKNAWVDVFLLRNEYKKIDPIIIAPYLLEANEKKMVYSKKWLQYGNLNFFEKFLLLKKCVVPVFCCSAARLYGKIGRLLNQFRSCY